MKCAWTTAALIAGMGVTSAFGQGIGVDSVRWDPVSLDAASPSVGVGGVNTNSIYQRRTPGEWSGFDVGGFGPLLHVAGTNLGLQAGDLLDGISLNSPASVAAVYFTVDRGSQGAATSDVRHQAVRNQHSADRFVTAVNGVVGGPLAVTAGNVLSSNHQKYALQPTYVPVVPFNDAAAINATLPGAQDNAASLEIDDIDTDNDQAPNSRLYFSLGAGSPSLTSGITVPTPSKNDVFSSPAGVTIPANITRFASAAGLGLGANDELDALSVWDANGDGVGDVGEYVAYSLAPGSPALGGSSPADIFLSVREAGGWITIPWLTAADLGLLPGDNIDGIDFSNVYSAPDAQFVPEPATFAALGLAALATGLRRRRAAV